MDVKEAWEKGPKTLYIISQKKEPDYIEFISTKKEHDNCICQDEFSIEDKMIVGIKVKTDDFGMQAV